MANVEGFGFDSHWTSWFSFDYYGRSFIAPTVFLSALSSTVSLAASLLQLVEIPGLMITGGCSFYASFLEGEIDDSNF